MATNLIMIMISCFSITLLLFLLWAFMEFLNKVWWKPYRIRKMLNSQGINGPSYKFPYGNTTEITEMRSQTMAKPMDLSHDIFPRIQPHVQSYSKIYGRKNYINWHGSQAQLFLTDAELIKEVLTNKEGAYPKMEVEGSAKKLLGEALITNEGEKWAKVRKLANHTFHAESLKAMVPAMCASVEAMLEKWKHCEGKEIDVFKEFGLLTTEVISRTAFGSSYEEGKSTFEMVAKLTAITVRNVYTVRIPGISTLMKSSDEIEAEKLVQRIKSSIMELVRKREKEKQGETENFGSDYLGQLMNITRGSDVNKTITMDQMIDEIKALYGAGHLTTKNMLAWILNKVWLRPIYVQYCMRSQGIKGPSYQFLHGNTKDISMMRRTSSNKAMEAFSHDIFPRILPDVYQWKNLYGPTYLNWHGTQAQLVVTEPDLVKEILNNKNGEYPKIDLEGYAKLLLGDGLSSSKGEKWARMRKLANQVFHAESLKSMVPAMIASTEIMLSRWKDNEGQELEVFNEFRMLTSEVISRTAFGSSYMEGKNIFDMLMKLTLIVSRNAHKIKYPGISWLLKSSDDVEAEKLERGIKNSIRNIIQKKEQEKEETSNELKEKEEGIGAGFAVAAIASIALLGWLLGGSESGNSRRKTMKAPGQEYSIFRDDFEKDPASWFRDHRRK
ncbi:OLC1v1032565C1 [Oldenlandia corymbosa var. corymbosa]|uniref:OLC1v1032565C1 n=1 Tax=Oldenlandia corymbosa var. corymbosa TaxID=529605 RepID=A0AAV1CP68_OLDCO|nr:OLC1v1032565C1 [Oldenlandia corymbosa var. corymbosa]